MGSGAAGTQTGTQTLAGSLTSGTDPAQKHVFILTHFLFLLLVQILSPLGCFFSIFQTQCKSLKNKEGERQQHDPG